MRLRAKNTVYSLRAKKFASIVCDPGSGGSDAAVFDGTDGNETFTYHGADNAARMQGKARSSGRGIWVIIVRAGARGRHGLFHRLARHGLRSRRHLHFKSHKTSWLRPTCGDAGIRRVSAASERFRRGRDLTTKDDHFECRSGTALFGSRNAAQICSTR